MNKFHSLFTSRHSQHKYSSPKDLQGSAKRQSQGLVNFVGAVACHFCLALPVAFTQPRARLLAVPCSKISVFTCGDSTQVYKSILSSVGIKGGIKGFFMHFAARKALEHGLLRPQSSNLRSGVTSKII